MVIAILTDGGEVDQVVEDMEVARREGKWLRENGCTVRYRHFEDWESYNLWQDARDARTYGVAA